MRLNNGKGTLVLSRLRSESLFVGPSPLAQCVSSLTQSTQVMINVCSYWQITCRHKRGARLHRGSVIFQFMRAAHLEALRNLVITATVVHTAEPFVMKRPDILHRFLSSFLSTFLRSSVIFFRSYLSTFSPFSCYLSSHFRFSSLAVFLSPFSCTSSCLARVWL
jgi:hypothetical protein